MRWCSETTAADRSIRSASGHVFVHRLPFPNDGGIGDRPPRGLHGGCRDSGTQGGRHSTSTIVTCSPMVGKSGWGTVHTRVGWVADSTMSPGKVSGTLK